MWQRGVTLIQMMCALALASLLTHLGVTAYNNMRTDLQQAALARELAQTLREARNQAALQQRAVLVQPLAGGWGHGWRSSFEHDGRLLREYRSQRPARIAVTDARLVRFSARGVPLGAGFGGVTLSICQGNGPLSQHQVVLSPSGRVRLQNAQGGGC